MTITNTQTTELSLDQLENISAGGLFGAALKGAKVLKKVVTKKNIAKATFTVFSAEYLYSEVKENWEAITTESKNITQKITGSFSSLFFRR